MAVVEASGGEPLPSKAMVVAGAGGPEVMSPREMLIPAPAPQQVRVRQTAIAINYLDLKYRRGLLADVDLPGIPGVEGVGEIIDVGERVNGIFPSDLSFKPGD
jgi:NADPH2:quinone reductase